MFVTLEQEDWCWVNLAINSHRYKCPLAINLFSNLP